MSDADFRMIRPIQITDAKLIASSIPEALVSTYASGTTYALGDQTGITTGTAQIVYESLQAANLGNDPASSPEFWKVLGTVYAPYSAGTTYALGDKVSSIALDVHEVYESNAAGNLGNDLTDPLKWLPLGRTNRHKMFDKAVNSQSSAPESLAITVAPGELANTLTLLNVDAAAVTVTQSESGYSTTKSLVRHEVLNWYDFYYEEPIRSGDVVFDGIPPYINSNLTVTAYNPGANAAIGGFFIGKSRTIGLTQWEGSGGVISYSGSTTSKFGDITMVKRANAKRVTLPVRIPQGYEDEAYRLLTLYTDVEMIFIGSNNYAMTIAYGYLGQWDVPLSKNGKNASIEIRGLT